MADEHIAWLLILCINVRRQIQIAGKKTHLYVPAYKNVILLGFVALFSVVHMFV